MKIINITVVAAAAGIALMAFLWSDTKDPASSFSPGNKEEKAYSESKGEKMQAPASSGITIKDRWQMPEVLREISGLSYIGNDRFACVQDELGKIFIYNTKTSAIEKEVSFGDAGDYEGLAIVNETAWVLRADGRLFEVSNFNTEPVVKEHATHLTIEQNVEGLCYDKNNNRLLVAIKDEEPGNANYKGIYSFDLAAKKMPAEPVFKINMDDDVFRNVRNNTKKKKGSVIRPSAIAIHPATSDIYITDGPKRKLLVLNKAGIIKNIYQLNNNEFAQPEGITFKTNGEMFIANEGSRQPGNILNVVVGEE